MLCEKISQGTESSKIRKHVNLCSNFRIRINKERQVGLANSQTWIEYLLIDKLTFS